MRKRIMLVVAILAGSAILPASAQETPVASAATDEGSRYQLRAGDRMQYRVAEDPATGAIPLLVAVNTVGEASFPVSRDSDIRITLPVRGKSLAEVKETVRSRLLEEYYNKATVELTLDEKTLTPGKVQFFGEMSGMIALLPDQPPVSLSEAILQLRAPEFADLRRVKLHRMDPVTQQVTIKEVDVRSILKDGRRDRDVILQDGDRVEVPQKWIN